MVHKRMKYAIIPYGYMEMQFASKKDAENWLRRYEKSKYSKKRMSIVKVE